MEIKIEKSQVRKGGKRNISTQAKKEELTKGKIPNIRKNS